MGIIIPAVGAAVLGIGLGVVYSKLVIKDYPEKNRKSSSVLAVVFFLVIALAVFGILFGRSAGIAAINEQTAKMEQHIIDNHPQNVLVRDGLDLSTLDSSRAGAAVAALQGILPSANDLGVPKMIYDYAAGFVTKELQKKLSGAEKIKDAFTEDNVLTVSSLTNGFGQSAIRVVKIASLVLMAIVIVFFAIYLICTLSFAAKARKKAKG